jgi:acetylornithine deacetylase/succinyl-diaminopimelate desuccinylase-like protein
LKVTCRIAPGGTVEDCIRWVRHRGHLAIGSDGKSRLSADIRRERKCLFTGRTAEVICATEPWLTDGSNPLVVRACEALRMAQRDKVQLRVLNSKPAGTGATGGLLVCRHGVPALVFGPGEGRFAYARHESVAVPALLKAVLGNALLAAAILDCSTNGTSPTLEHS